MFPVQGSSAATPERCLPSTAGEVPGQGTGWPGVGCPGGVELGAELLCQQQHTWVSHSGSQVRAWAKQLSFKEQQMVCCRADGIEG